MGERLPHYVLRARAPSNTIYVHWDDPETGERNRVSAKTKDRAEARLRARDIILGVVPVREASPKVQQRSKVPTMADLFELCRHSENGWRDVKSVATLESNIRLLTLHVGHMPVAEMTKKVIAKIRVDLGEGAYNRRKLTEPTVKRKLETLTRALRFACEEDDPRTGKPYLAGMPAVPRLKNSKPRTRVMSEEETALVMQVLAELIEEQPHRDWWRFMALIKFFLHCGVRKANGIGVLASRVRKNMGVLSVYWPDEEMKSGKRLDLPLSDELAEMMPRLKAEATASGHLFPFKANDVNTRWSKIRARVKLKGGNIDDVVPHSLRHGCATALGEDPDLQIEDISRWLGHGDIAITQKIYMHLGLRHQMRAFRSMKRRSQPNEISEQHEKESEDA